MPKIITVLDAREIQRACAFYVQQGCPTYEEEQEQDEQGDDVEKYEVIIRKVKAPGTNPMNDDKETLIAEVVRL